MASLQASANGPTITGQEDIQDPDAHMTNALPHQMENGNTGGFHLYDNIPLYMGPHTQLKVWG